MFSTFAPLFAVAIAAWMYSYTSVEILNPFAPKQVTKMNVDKCVELHNEIVKLGWEGLGRDFNDYKPKKLV